jgi:hypothetical protein
MLGALGGAELAMRSQLMSGGERQLAGMVPSFAYLVTLPALGEAEAQALSRRAEELLGAESDGHREG